MDIPLFGSGPYATPPRSQFRTSQNPAHISDLRTEERTIGQLPDWGSSVDIPGGSSVPTAPPVRTAPIAPLGPPIAPLGAPIAPTIHVQPPTAQASTAGGARSHVTRASPRSTPQKIVDDAQSVGGMSRRTAQSKARDQQSPASIKSQHRTALAMSEKSVRAETENAYEDPLLPPLPSPRPWDVVTQRLFSWAMVWPPEDFVRSLETTALGQQVDEFALTIYMMTIFKRNLRHRMCSVPPLPCDKLFVPPNLADSVNRAVHSKRFADARQILEELWYPFGFKEPPRVIVALAKHRNDANHWSAHRFDLTSGKLVTFSYSTEEKSLVDGRPFMWWFAIRDAWPTWNIPHPDHLAQKTQRVITPESSRDDNALMAANCGRNLMLGWKPDQTTDLKKMRNNIWNEVSGRKANAI
ncbi:hypothetical protein HD553DRAFT_85796 [Filobasidium floriforme]|uniref:uncharacterized protein n=1 Tax=Filobasidium floriforme TaxID=5210 RepID=UPI001E8DE158|nr:uncharacterized protein HD553DRAFT_85796 [Filobasidium floriforme]KAH8081113.1 hypothetical protein HD553DRAFT_85796 [Filobasidium floriforme]